MQGLAVCQNGKNTWSFVWLHPLLTSGFPLGMTSPNVTASLCFLVCVLVSATSVIPASSSLLPLLPPLFLLHRQFSLVLTSTSFVFPASLTLLPLLHPLSLLPRLRFLASAASYPPSSATSVIPPRCSPRATLATGAGWGIGQGVRACVCHSPGGCRGALMVALKVVFGGVWVLVKILMGVMCSCFCWLVLG